MSKRRYVGDYAREIKVGDTYVQTAPGDFVELSGEDEEDVENKEMIENGTLIEGEPPKEEESAKATTADKKEGGAK